MLDFDQFPDLKYTWAGTHHFFDASRYYSNYLFAWVLAIAVNERLDADPLRNAIAPQKRSFVPRGPSPQVCYNGLLISEYPCYA